MHDDFSSRTLTISRVARLKVYCYKTQIEMEISKEYSVFFFVEKEKLSARKIDLNDFDQVFYTAERSSCFEMQPRQHSL